MKWAEKSRPRVAQVFLVFCLLSGRADAQTTAQRISDWASWGTVGVSIALDTKASWESQDRSRAFILQGVRIGVTNITVALLKHFYPSDRPCRPDCGIDEADRGFPSGHTANSFSTIGGSRLVFTVPLSVGTGVLRVAANKHTITQVLAGAGIGLLTSRIR